eukprot:2215582-Pyramimonas_sp.AAC.1
MYFSDHHSLPTRLACAIVTSLELTPVLKIDTPKGDGNLRDAPSNTEGTPKMGVVMGPCPA